MAPISKISNIAASSINKVDGIAKSSIGKFNNLSFASSTTDYISAGLEFHVNSQDANSYSGAGTTTWTDLAGTENMTLVNGPTKPAGEDYVAFDGNDDRGLVTWNSSDYFYGSTSDFTFWNTMTIQVVASWPEDGSTGFIPIDSHIHMISRHQSTTRGFRCFFGRLGASFDLFYGTRMDCRWPNTSDFQYNSSRGYYEPKPNQVYSFAITMDRTASDGHFNAYVNGQNFTPSSIVGSLTQLNSTSRWNSTYINFSQVRKGRDTMNFQIGQTSNGSLGASGFTCNIFEILLYNSQLSQTNVAQNLTAYTDRYGALNP